MANKSDNIIEEEARAIEVGEETGGTPQQRRQRDSWASRTGFIFACVGSAVGMANIWLFPYRVAQLGGAAFLIPYLIFVALLGFTGVIGEMSFGRAMGTGPMGAFGKAMEMRGIRKGGLIGKIVGLVPTLGSLALAIGYAVVLGWACHYLFSSLTGELMAQSDMGAFFGGIASDFGNVGFHVAGLVITFVIMILGVSRGIERVNKVLMPLLFILFIVIAVRVAMLSGAFEGYLYLLVPRWEALLNPTTWVYALGQAFFSLSLAGCGTLVYGSYLKKDVDVVSAARNVAIFDTIASLVAACCCPRRICLRARCFLRSAAALHHACASVPANALRRHLRRHSLRRGRVRGHHQPHEPFRGARRSAPGATRALAYGLGAHHRCDCGGRGLVHRGRKHRK